MDQIAAAPPQDIATQNAANANEAFLVNGSLSTGLQTDQNDFGLRAPVLGLQGLGGLQGAGVESVQRHLPFRGTRVRRHAVLAVPCGSA